MEHGTRSRRRTAVLPRKRLTAVLEAVTTHKLALITAPGGYGKTTLVRDLMALLPSVAFGWVALDPADASLPIFLQQLARAVARYLPPGGFFRFTPDGALTDPGAVRHLGRLIAAELDQHAEDHLVIVLDDLHLVSSSEQVMLFLDALLQHLPDSVHLIAATRRRPYLPLARLKARGELIHLTAADLSFTDEEVRQFFAEHLKLPLPDDVLKLLMDRTEGWVTALLLLGNVLAPLPQGEWSSFLSRFPGGGALFDFLAEEVFSQQPPDLQEFLLGSCVLSTLQPLVVERMLGISGAGAVLQELEARNLFLVAVVQDGPVYRYHYLFQAFLRRQLAARGGEAEVARLHTQAGRIYEGLGNLAEAVEHYLRAKDFLRAAVLMAEQADAAMKSLRHDVIRGWLEQIPPDLQDTEPDVVFVRAQMASWLAQYEVLTPLCQRMLDLYEERQDYRGLTRALAFATLRFGKLRHPYFRDAATRWAAHPDPEVRIYGRMLQACARTALGEWAEAFADMEQLLQEIPPATRAYFDCLEVLAGVAFWRADCRATLKYSLPQTTGKTALGDFSWGIWNWMSYCLLGDPVGLELYHRQYLAQEIPVAMSRLHELVGILGQGIVHLYHRRWEDALASFEALQPYFTGNRTGFRPMGSEATFIAQMEMAGIYARFGRRDEARACLVQNLQLAAGYLEMAAIAHSAMAQFLVEANDLAGAWHHLAKAQELNPLGLDGLTTITVQAAAARLALAEGDRAAARQHLARAVEITRERECPWFLLHKGGPEILPLLVELARSTLPGGRPGQVVVEMIGGLGDQAAQMLGPLVGHSDAAVRAAAFALLDHVQNGPVQQGVPVLKVSALGPLRAYRYDQPVDSAEWKRNKVKLLLVILLLRRGKPVLKEQVMELLWPEAPPATARTNLRATMSGLKRVLEPDLPPGGISRFVVSDRDSLGLGAMDEVWFDLWELEDLIARARSAQRGGRADQAAQLLQAACDLSRGTFLPEPAFADYFQDVRVRTEQVYLDACLEVARARLIDADPRGAVEYARRALLLDRSVEDAYQVLIQAYLAMGDRDRAMQAYKTCVKYLRQLLGSEPSPSTHELLLSK